MLKSFQLFLQRFIYNKILYTYEGIGKLKINFYLGRDNLKKCMDSENLHRRLKKIIGQLNAIDRMIDEDVPCENILMQINASKSALHKVGHIIAEGHLNHCIKEAIEAGDTDEALSDVSIILEYYSRL